MQMCMQEAEEANVPPPKYSTNSEIAYTVMDFLFASQVTIEVSLAAGLLASYAGTHTCLISLGSCLQCVVLVRSRMCMMPGLCCSSIGSTEHLRQAERHTSCAKAANSQAIQVRNVCISK